MAFTVLTFSLITIITTPCDANNFLRADPSHTRRTKTSQDEAKASLLQEIEGSIGDGSTARRVARLEATLIPTYNALPKNEHGNLGHATVRYALHRYFVHKHGWYIRGLEPDGESFSSNSSRPTQALDDRLPNVVQTLFEERLHGKGFNLHDTAVFAATLEHLIHEETVRTLQKAYGALNLDLAAAINQTAVDEVLDTYMKIFIAGEESLVFSDKDFLYSYPGWTDTKDFVRDMRKNVEYAEGEHSMKAKQQMYSFSMASHIIEDVARHFGVFQDSECKQMKEELLGYGDRETGLVTLSAFYNAALEHGSYLYNEPQDYLRELGALDERNSQLPYVIVPNYINSKSNCLATSEFFSVCCINECEPLMAQLETRVAAPEASAEDIIAIVEALPSSTVEAPRRLPEQLLQRLRGIASTHGGNIPIHGRLFAQWMHHAFPRECAYPHVAGASNPQTPDEWMARTGAFTASAEEMAQVVNASIKHNSTAPKELLWSAEEELFALRAQPAPRGIVRNFFDHAFFIFGLAGAAYLSWSIRSMGTCVGKMGKRGMFSDEKHYV